MVTLLITIGTYLVYESFGDRKKTLRILYSFADIIGGNAKTSLSFNDEKGAAETLSVLHSQPTIIMAYILQQMVPSK